MLLRNALFAVVSLVAGALALLALLEVAFRLLPTMSGLEPNADVEAWPLRSYEAVRPYQYSYGWAMLNAHRGTTNNYGQIAPQDFHPGSRPMIVVGDSYIESLMNDYADTLQGILGLRLGPERPVYGFGLSGLSASDYVVLVRQARDEFAPKAAVLLITDGDMVESLAPRAGGYHLARRGTQLTLEYQPLSPNPAMEWVRRHVGRLALYDYLRLNLKFSPGDVFAAVKVGRGSATRAPSAPPQASSGGRDVLEWFLRELPQAAGVAPSCTVLLVDADRYAIYDASAASEPKDSPETRRLLIERGTELGFHVVDLEPLFRSEYERSRSKLDHWPVDRHWNRHGHSVAADAVMAALFSGATSACTPGLATEAYSSSEIR
jgi:hypothetical protein